MNGNDTLRQLVLQVKRKMSREYFNTEVSRDSKSAHVASCKKKLDTAEKEKEECQREPFGEVIGAIVRDYPGDSCSELLTKIKDQMKSLENGHTPVQFLKHALGALPLHLYEERLARPLNQQFEKARENLREAQKSLLDFEKDFQQQMVVKNFFENKFKLEYHEDEILPSQSVTASPPSQRMESQEEPRASVPIPTSPDRIYSLPTAPPTTFAHQVARRDAPRASVVPSYLSDLPQNQDELPPQKRAEKRKIPEVSDGESESSSFSDHPSQIRSSSERDSESESGASESGSSSGSEHKGGDSSSDEEDAPVRQSCKKAKVTKQPMQRREFQKDVKAKIDQQVVNLTVLISLKSCVNQRDVIHKCDGDCVFKKQCVPPLPPFG